MQSFKLYTMTETLNERLSQSDYSHNSLQQGSWEKGGHAKQQHLQVQYLWVKTAVSSLSSLAEVCESSYHLKIRQHTSLKTLLQVDSK